MSGKENSFYLSGALRRLMLWEWNYKGEIRSLNRILEKSFEHQKWYLIFSLQSLYKAFMYPEAMKATFQIENPTYHSRVSLTLWHLFSKLFLKWTWMGWTIVSILQSRYNQTLYYGVLHNIPKHPTITVSSLVLEKPKFKFTISWYGVLMWNTGLSQRQQEVFFGSPLQIVNFSYSLTLGTNFCDVGWLTLSAWNLNHKIAISSSVFQVAVMLWLLNTQRDFPLSSACTIFEGKMVHHSHTKMIKAAI